MADDRPAIRILTDAPWSRHDATVVLPARAPAQARVAGAQVILQSPDDLVCDGVVRRGENGEWLADIVAWTTGYGPDVEAASKDPLPRVWTDFNKRGGDYNIFYLITRHIPPQARVVGTRVRLVLDYDVECEAILHQNEREQWLGVVIEGTWKDLPSEPEALRRFWGEIE